VAVGMGAWVGAKVAVGCFTGALVAVGAGVAAGAQAASTMANATKKTNEYRTALVIPFFSFQSDSAFQHMDIISVLLMRTKIQVNVM